MQIRFFSTTKALRLDPGSFTSLAFAAKKVLSVRYMNNPLWYVAVGLASVLFIHLNRVDPTSNISSNLEHLANLVEIGEKLNEYLINFNHATERSVNDAMSDYFATRGTIYVYYPFEGYKELYDSLCQMYTTTYGLNDAFETTYEIFNELDNEDAQEFANRTTEVRKNLTARCNEMLKLMRYTESYMRNYDFFTKKLPNFWLE
jgi:hypothetical protein